MKKDVKKEFLSKCTWLVEKIAQTEILKEFDYQPMKAFFKSKKYTKYSTTSIAQEVMLMI